MSTFAVFGMNRALAVSMARKITPATRGGVEIPLEEWEQAVSDYADVIMSGTRTAQLCQPFDAPQFAQQFMQLVREQDDCRDLHVKARTVKKDASGNPMKTKKGAPMMGWQPWSTTA